MAGIPHRITLEPKEWMLADIACRGFNPEVFFQDKGHFLANRRAIEICNTCPHQLDCLEYALDHHIADGVWGGTTGKDRRRIARARRERTLPLRLAIDPENPPSSAHG